MQHCLELGSYNAMFAIYSGISNGAVSRMERTMRVCTSASRVCSGQIFALIRTALNMP